MLKLFLFLSFVNFSLADDKLSCDKDIDHIRFSYVGEEAKPFYQIIFLTPDSKVSTVKDSPFVKSIILTRSELDRIAAIIDSVKVDKNTYDLAKGAYSFQIVSDKNTSSIVVGHKKMIVQIFGDVCNVLMNKENKEEVLDILRTTLVRLGIKESI